ncbi:MAG: hypothetical protein OEY36_03980 [Gammaproteobacteria bacterium]|nr:hypothetical protein [Gammaproteobacteria bacterium]
MRAISFRYATAFIILCTVMPQANSVAENDFKQWMQQQQNEFQEYKDLRDKEFTSFLQSQWKEMKILSGVKRDPAPKPARIPVAKPVIKTQPRTVPDATRPQARPVPVVKPKLVAVKKPPEVVQKPIVKPVVVSVPKGEVASFNFFGQSLAFYYDPKMKSRLSGRINEQAISQFWSALSKSDYDGLLEQINKQRQPLQLSDWSYALLINELAKTIYNNSKNEEALFTWFMLIKANYQARLAFDNYKVFLLLPTQQRLYSQTYFTFGGKRYYALGMDGNKAKPGKVFTYNGEYPRADKVLDMSMSQNLNTGANQQSRKVSFIYNRKSYNIDVGYDKNTINYLQTYPQMDIDQYFSSRVNASVGNPLLTQLRNIIKGKTEEEAVNILLLFVQNAFKYKTDQGQFGEENYLFPEETMYYPYSDCEDRSVIFAWLVRSLTGLEVVGLDLPGHIAAAVHFSTDIKGDSVRYKGTTYVVTDPTFINARAGMMMPQYKSAKPKVIKFNAL